MPAFRYQASDIHGKLSEGVAEADNERSIRNQLRNKGLFPIRVTPIETVANQQRKKKNLSGRDRLQLTRELANMLSADLPIDTALQTLIDQTEEQHIKEVLADVRVQVTSGGSLTSALKAHPQSFPELYVAMISAGEASGKLSEILEKMVDWLEEQDRLKQKVISAMTYPIIVMSLSLLVILGLMIYVLPKIVGVFIQTKQQLPLLTQILLGISTWLTHWWWTLIPVGMLFAWGWRQMREVSHLRQKRDTWLLKKMLIGPLIKNFNTTQFAGTLSTLLSSGVPLLQSLESAAQTMPNHAMRQAVRQAIVKVREGGALSKALSESKKFPPVLIQMISNGEKTGKLTQMLTKAASIERLQLERKLVLASSLLEPIMIVIMGGVVLLIVLAVLMPIININQMVK